MDFITQPQTQDIDPLQQRPPVQEGLNNVYDIIQQNQAGLIISLITIGFIYFKK